MIFEDYDKVKARMCKLILKLKSLERPSVLAHADSVADNFIFISDSCTETDEGSDLLPKLID